ncbi:MAG: MMPL family transporter [Solirubrobacterales bacterium]
MTAPLYAIGRFCSKYHWPVIAAWVVAAVALVLLGQASGDKTNDNLTLPGTGSTNATNLLNEDLPAQANGTNPMVMVAPAGSRLTDQPYAKAVSRTVANLDRDPNVTSAVSPLSAAGKNFLSKDERTGYIPVVLSVAPADLDEDEAQAVLDAANPAEAAGLDVSIGGYVGQQLSKPSTEISEAIGITAAVIILLFAFGTVTAMAMPILSAVLGLACALSLIKLAESVMEVPSVASTLATMIGLGVGIDYALFIVTRHKLQLRDGMEMMESVARATATAGGAVVFAGFTVMIALCSLFVAGIPLVTSLGLTAAIAVVVAVAAAITLLPAMLGALGPRIDSLRVKLGRTHPDDSRPHGWERWATWVAGRPLPCAIVAGAILVVLALPIRDLELGQQDNSSLPSSSTARQAYDGIAAGFGPGYNSPLLIAVKLGRPAEPDQANVKAVERQQQQLEATKQQLTAEAQAAGLPPQEAAKQADQKTASQQRQLDEQRKKAENPAGDPRLTNLEKQISGQPDVAAVTPAILGKKKTVAAFTAVSKSSPSADSTVALVKNLRDTVIPGAVKGTDLAVYVGGQTAGYIDLAEEISQKLPLMILLVVGLSFVVLLVAFRSIFVPLKAAFLNLLSVGAAYGVVTAVFQKGWGSSLVGLDHAIPIVSYVPLLMFAILFGLSMDYEVFLLTQMREHYLERRDAKRSVIEGLSNTGRVITSAALIMVFVFSSFVLNGNPVVKEFGVGLAIAIAIDATVVRCLLVPALMVLLGDRAWWLPERLDRILPRISVEGEGYFEGRAAGKPAVAAAESADS